MESNRTASVWNRIVFAMLCSLIVLTALPYGTVHPPVIALFYLLTAVTFLFAALDALSRGSVRIGTSLVQLPLLAAILYAFFQILPFGTAPDVAGLGGIPDTISKDPFWTLMTAMHFVALAIVLTLGLTALDSAKRIRRLAVFITAFGFAFAFFAIIQSFLSPTKIYGVYETAFAKPFGSFVNRHNFAAFMEMSIAIPLGLLLHGAVKRDKRLLLATTVALMAVALLMSGSRGGLFALAAQVVLLLLLARGRVLGGRVWLKGFLAIVLVAVIVAGAAFIGGETSMSRLSETAASEDFSTKRTQIWEVTLKVISENLPWGAGFGAFGAAYTAFDPQNGLERVEQAHNDYLQLVADAGVVGVGIGLLFLFALVKSARNLMKIDDVYRRGVGLGALAGIFGILVHSLFDFVLHTTAVSYLFVMLLALLSASQKRYADDFSDVVRGAPPPAPGNVTRIEDMKRVN